MGALGGHSPDQCIAALKEGNTQLRLTVIELVNQCGKVCQEAKHHDGHLAVRLIQKRVLDKLEEVSSRAISVLDVNLRN